MAAGSGSLNSSQARRDLTDIGAELAAIHTGLGESPLAGRVEHLQGLFAEGITPIIADCQERMLQQAQEAFEGQDLDGAENLLRDRVFEVKIDDTDITANLRALIDAAKAQMELDPKAVGHLFEAEKAMQESDFPAAREALDKARACSPQNGALNKLRRLEEKYDTRPTTQTLDTQIKGCNYATDVSGLDEAEEAERQRERALSRTNSDSSAPMGSPEPRAAAAAEASPPATVAEAPTPKAAAAEAAPSSSQEKRVSFNLDGAQEAAVDDSPQGNPIDDEEFSAEIYKISRTLVERAELKNNIRRFNELRERSLTEDQERDFEYYKERFLFRYSYASSRLNS